MRREDDFEGRRPHLAGLSDEALHALHVRTSFSRYLNPINSEEARRDFLAGDDGPVFRYHPADWADDELRMLDALRPPQDHPLGVLLQRSIERTIDSAEVEALRERHGIATDSHVGLTVSALVREKDPLSIVRALPHLPSDYRHVLVGDGPLKADVVRLADELGVTDKLVLPGFDPAPEAWFGIADVFVFPSRWEALGMVALDAFLFGVPVVASK